MAPLDGQPAIDYTGTGGLELNTGLALGRPFAIVRVGTASTLTLQKPIIETEEPRGIRKQGLGVLRYSSANAYTGATIVEQGSLVLMQINAIADTASVEVRQDALLTVLKPEAIGALTIIGGFVDISATPDGVLLVSSLHMTGGNIHSSAGGRLLYLGGNVTATSSPSQQPPIIEPSVSIELFQATRTFTVLDGPGNIDLEIRGQIFASHAAPSVGLMRHHRRAPHRAEAGTADGARRSDRRPRKRLAIRADRLRSEAAADRRAIAVLGCELLRRSHRERRREARTEMDLRKVSKASSTPTC